MNPNLAAFGRGVLTIILRLLDMMDDLMEPRFILGAISFVGFFFVVFRVIDKLVNPPASELFTILNLVLTVVMSIVSFFFGVEVGRRRNGGGTPPPAGG